MLGLYGFFRFINIEFHFVQLPEQIVGELQIRLVDFIDQKHDLFVGSKGFSQLSQLDILFNVGYIAFSELAVIKSLYGIVHIEPFLRLGR